MGMEEAIIYARVSPKPEHKKDRCESIDTQIEGCQAYCQSYQMNPSVILRDPGVSASKNQLLDRPEGRKIMTLGYRHIVVLKLDRMFRSTADGLLTIKEFHRRGITLHLANESGVSLTSNTDEGYYVLTMLLARAEYEAAKTGSTTAHALNRIQKQGRIVSRSCRYGYREIESKGADNRRRFERCEEEQFYADYIEEMRGEKIGATWTEASDRMNREGLLLRGARWNRHKTTRFYKSVRRFKLEGDELVETIKHVNETEPIA